jgi:fluoroacetyl-CoA thioesterase
VGFVHVERARRSELTHVVSDADTARALGSGDVEVISTSRIVGLCEEAAAAALPDNADDGMSVVTVGIQLEHVQPSAVGASLRAEAVLDGTEGRKLVFTVHIHDHCGLVAAGKLTRVIVDTERFTARCR